MEKKRSVELDILRFFALLFVVCLHAGNGLWSSNPIASGDWVQLTIMRTNWPVPIFVMISGRFFLEPEKPITINKMFTRYIKRIVIAFVFWSAVYQIYYYLRDISIGGADNWKAYVYGFCTGAYHMWYLLMLIGLYIITPLLRRIAEDKKLTKYFLLIAFIFHIITFFGESIPVLGSVIADILKRMHFEFVSGYVIYYLMGYYLYKYEISKKTEIAFYAVALFLLVSTKAADILLSLYQDSRVEYFAQNLAPTTMIYSSAIFLFFVKRVSKCKFSERTVNICKFLTDYGFGAYLSHALVIRLFIDVMKIDMSILPPFLTVPIITVIVTCISIGLAFLLRKIPIIGKYIA